MKKVLVLGCTGSIGSQTLDICRNMSDEFQVCGVAAGKNIRCSVLHKVLLLKTL